MSSLAGRPFRRKCLAARVRVARLARRAGLPYVVSPRGTLDRWALNQSPVKKKLHLAVVGRSVLRHASAAVR